MLRVLLVLNFFFLSGLIACEEYFDTTSSDHIGSTHYLVPGRIMLELMSTSRRGWTYRGIPPEEAESVWQHTLKLEKATRVYFSHFNPLERNHAALMARVHDIAKGIVGDVIPSDRISREVKRNNEYFALQEIKEDMSKNDADYVERVWLEYDNKKTYVSNTVSQLDKLETAVQGIVYAQKGYQTEDLIENIGTMMTNSELLSIYHQLYLDYRDGVKFDPYNKYYFLLKNL